MIPANVSRLGKETFFGCKKLRTVIIEAEQLEPDQQAIDEYIMNYNHETNLEEYMAQIPELFPPRWKCLRDISNAFRECGNLTFYSMVSVEVWWSLLSGEVSDDYI